MVINISLIVLSLKYINDNYKNVSSVSKWMYEELVKSQYDDCKLVKSLNKLDLESIDLLIKSSRDKRIINDLFSYALLSNKSQDDLLKIIKIFVNNNNTDIHADNKLILMQASFFGYHDIIKFLIDNGVDGSSRKALGISSESPFIYTRDDNVINCTSIHVNLGILKYIS